MINDHTSMSFYYIVKICEKINIKKRLMDSENDSMLIINLIFK
jgi:hypothetical protein